MIESTEEEVLDSSTSEGDLSVDSPATTVDDADTGTSSAEIPDSSTKPKSTKREDLIKSLTGQKAEEDDSEEESEEDEVDAEEADAPEAKTDDAEDSKEEKPKESANKAEPDDSSTKRSKAQKRFEVLTSHNRDLKTKLEQQAPVATYGQNVLDFCRDAKLTPEKLGVWLSVAAAAEADPASAEVHLAKLGVKAKHIVQTVKEVPQELEDKILDLASEGSLTPEGVKALLSITRTARAAQKPPEPAPEPAAPKQTQTLATPPSVEKVAYDKRLAKAVIDIDNKDAEFAKKYPTDWKALQPQVSEAMKRYQGTDPSRWISFFEDEVAKAVAKVKRPQTPQKSLRPSTSNTSTSANKPAPNSRAALMAELTGKTR